MKMIRGRISILLAIYSIFLIISGEAVAGGDCGGGGDDGTSTSFTGLATGKIFIFPESMSVEEMQIQALKSELRTVTGGVEDILSDEWGRSITDIYGGQKGDEFSVILLDDDDPKMIEKLIEKQKGDIAKMKERIKEIEAEKRKNEEESLAKLERIERPEVAPGVFDELINGEKSLDEILADAKKDHADAKKDLDIWNKKGMDGLDDMTAFNGENPNSKLHKAASDVARTQEELDNHRKNLADLNKKEADLEAQVAAIDKKLAELEGQKADDVDKQTSNSSDATEIYKRTQDVYNRTNKSLNATELNWKKQVVNGEIMVVISERAVVLSGASEIELEHEAKMAKSKMHYAVQDAVEEARHKVVDVEDVSPENLAKLNDFAKKFKDFTDKDKALTMESEDLQNKISDLEEAHKKINEQLNKG